MGALLPPRFMARVRIKSTYGVKGGGETLGVRELCDRDPTQFERLAF